MLLSNQSAQTVKQEITVLLELILQLIQQLSPKLSVLQDFIVKLMQLDMSTLHVQRVLSVQQLVWSQKMIVLIVQKKNIV